MARRNPQPEQALAQEIKVIGGLLRLLRHLGILLVLALSLATLVGSHRRALLRSLPGNLGHQAPHLRAPRLPRPGKVGQRAPHLRAPRLPRIGNLDPRLRLAIGEVLLRLRRLGPLVLLRLGTGHVTALLGPAEVQGRTGSEQVD